MAPLTDISSRAFAHQNSSEPISRTMQYRKITKPLLERQRRARINRSLDELKDILITGLQSEGENVARLEKADILELTVRHLHKLQSQVLSSSPSSSSGSSSSSSESPMLIETSCIHNLGEDEKFRSGYSTCAKEVSRVLASTPKMDIQVGTSLMVHLGNALNQITHQNNKNYHHHNTVIPISSMSPNSLASSPMSSPVSSLSSYRPYTPPSSPEELTTIQNLSSPKCKQMWRPW